MRLFGSDNISGIMDKLGMEEDEPIEHKIVTRSIESAQKKVEARNFEIRKQVLEYDDVMNQQREIIYKQRQMVLDGEDISDKLHEMMKQSIDETCESFLSGETADDWDFAALRRHYLNWLCLPTDFNYTTEQLGDLTKEGIADELYLCDINEAKVTSEVQDLRDSLSFVPYNTKIVNCYDHYEELACCDVIVNAAGKVALAAGNRDGELFFTTDAARTFAKRIVDAGFDGIFVSISNPCDVVCTELWHLTGYDPKKIIGSAHRDLQEGRREPQVHRRLHDRRARL